MRYDDPNEYQWLMREILRHETVQAFALGKLLQRTFNPRSVVDIGCGPGIYLIPFRPFGTRIFGVDGCLGAGECLSVAEFERVDLRQPWTPTVKFDISMCIEVAEHIAPEASQVLVDTITSCAPLTFFSAATPGQGGEGHVNERPMSDWFEMFARRGFYLDDARTQLLHATIDRDEDYEHCHWLKNHSYILKAA